MSCFICNSKSPYWLLLNSKGINKDNINKDINLGKTVQTCSYSCSKKIEKYLPNNYGDLVLNKEDFCYWCVPVTKVEKKFEILSFEELQKMDVLKKEIYLQNLKQYCLRNNKNYEFYLDNYDEDEKTYNIENDMSSDEEVYSDDY